MTLPRKVILIVTASMLIWVVLLYAASLNVILTGVNSIEQRTITRDVTRVKNTLENEITALDRSADDYARWDDTYAFAKGENAQYPQENLNADALIGLNVNFVVITDVNGKILFQVAYDLVNKNEIFIPTSLLGLLPGNSILVKFAQEDAKTNGLIQLPEGTIMIASRPIRNSQGQGPIMGALMFGRFFNQDQVKLLATVTELSVSSVVVGGTQISDDFKMAADRITNDHPVDIQTIEGNRIAGYIILNDINNRPSLVLRVDEPRDTMAQGISSINTLMIYVLAIAIVLTLAVLLLLRNTVLSPLVRLDEEVSAITTRGDFASRVTTIGSDEYGRLATSFNQLLDSVEKRDIELRRTPELEQRVNLFHSTLEITRSMSNNLDRQELLDRTAQLLRERFSAYYAGVLFADEKGENASLIAGAGEPASKMRQENYFAPVDANTTLGWAIINRKARFTTDAGPDAVQFDNKYLPSMHSEIALPLISGDTAIGALHLASAKAKAFGENEAAALQNIADSLVSALNAADAYQQSQASLEEIRNLHRQYLGQVYSEISRSGELSYIYEVKGSDDKAEAINSVTIPISLRDQVIGRISLDVNKTSFTPQEMDLIESITTEAAIAMENTRLLDETQRRVERERLLTEISSKVRAPTDVEAVLRAAVKELCSTMNADEGLIHLEIND